MRLRGEKLEWRLAADEVIAVDLEQSTYLAVTGSGVPLWQALAEGATVDGLVELLLGTYAIERPLAEADVAEFLADLVARGLLDETPP